MLNIPVCCRLSSLKCSGPCGEQQLALTFTTAAEDALFGRECVGEAGRRTFEDLRQGRVGNPSILPPSNMRAKVTIHRDGQKVCELHQARVPAIALATSKDANDAPKAALKVEYGWGDTETLALLLQQYKQDLTIEVVPTQGDLLYEPAQPPKRRKKGGEDGDNGK
jgi:hypothetical protein